MSSIRTSATVASRTAAYAVLSLREIRNLLAIAEREADLHPDRNRDSTIVLVKGAAYPTGDGRLNVTLHTAGYSEGDFTLWSRHQLTSGPARVRSAAVVFPKSGTLDEVIDGFSAESNR